MLFLRNRTDPSAMQKLAPPGCRLWKPSTAAENRQPKFVFASHAPSLHAGLMAGKELGSQPRETVVPALEPFAPQKLLLASATGRTSPMRSELLVPSVTLAMVTICIVL